MVCFLFLVVSSAGRGRSRKRPPKRYTRVWKVCFVDFQPLAYMYRENKGAKTNLFSIYTLFLSFRFSPMCVTLNRPRITNS